MALSETNNESTMFKVVRCETFRLILPFGSVQRIVNSMLPTSDVECTNTRNEKIEIKRTKLLQLSSQKPLCACTFSVKLSAENEKRNVKFIEYTWLKVFDFVAYVLANNHTRCIVFFLRQFSYCGIRHGTMNNMFYRQLHKSAKIYFYHIHSSDYTSKNCRLDWCA